MSSVLLERLVFHVGLIGTVRQLLGLPETH